ncbi:hypothetical protein A2841_02500 [Candidatus Kaiserbacteria bacterium RIFCSPHIGHO2_01_FULL_48_10]|uniref:Anticodon-binding domain-containing protein n=1 Tax=Candidatus Kaiserbacteria bacterium RIFCSPHIGHO2_01_FULL_48_10 TaxID=1798476 RepID=A0A1F6C2U0_9BACT|nr:MAG: hypothetical protein A2841_02500 [Candidatus Kaiserbacteria bacterium RIFCSPHIGHO2_01_FULL_48_10]
MRHLERSRGHESLNASIERIAYAYGFSAPPVIIPKKAIQQTKTNDLKTGASLALLKHGAGATQPTYVWGIASGPKRSTILSFAIVAARHAIGNALAVKTVQAIANLLGLADTTVLVSSVGDQESKRRFVRELGTFFKKNSSSLSEETREATLRDPEQGYHEMIENNDPLLERAPKTIDYLSENSRKTMLDSLALFEAVGIPYALEPRLLGLPHTHTELLFAIEGTNRHGARSRVAAGGRFDDYMKREARGDMAVSMSIEVEDDVEPRTSADAIPSCYVVHVGDAAKLCAFTALETLWKANLLVGETLLSETLRDQIDRAKASKTKYIAIIGQREALDRTVIVRNTSNQLQIVMPLEKLATHVARR